MTKENFKSLLEFNNYKPHHIFDTMYVSKSIYGKAFVLGEKECSILRINGSGINLKDQPKKVKYDKIDLRVYNIKVPSIKITTKKKEPKKKKESDFDDEMQQYSINL